MVVGVVGLSFAKPMAFSRYFVVLLPALIPWLAVQGARVTLNRRGQATALAAIALLLALWWQQAFLSVGASAGRRPRVGQFPRHQPAHFRCFGALCTQAKVAQPQ